MVLCCAEGATCVRGRTGFRLLWAGQTASVFGTAISALAIPTIAIVSLHASPFAVGLLGAAQFAPFPILGLVAGVWVDRWSRRTTMLVADVVRAAALVTIPVAAALHALTFAELLAVAACVGTASVFFDVAYQSLVPSLVDRDRLEGANARLEFSNSAAQIAGNGLAGGLIALAGAPTAIVVDACSYVVSILTLSAMRVRETHRDDPSAERVPFVRALREGLAVVFESPVLLRLAGATATSNLGGSMVMAVYLLYAYRVLHLSPAVVGLIFALANAGFAGALFAPRIARRFGTGRTLVWSMSITMAAAFALPLALVWQPVAVLLAVELVITMGAPIYNITQVSLRQRLVPADLLGRMNATMKTLVWGTLPLGMLIGGALGNTIGIVPTLVAGAIVGICAVPWLLGDAIRTLPQAPAPAAHSSVMSSADAG
jgi:MFS family permease